MRPGALLSLRLLCLPLLLWGQAAAGQTLEPVRFAGTVGESLDIAFQYRLKRPLTPEGGVTLVPHWLLGGRFQFDDPRQPNYMQVQSPAGPLAGNWQLRDAYHGGEAAPAQVLAFSPAEALAPDALLRVSLSALALPDYVVDQLELLLLVDSGEGRPPERLPIIISSKPQTFSEIYLAAPPAVTVGQPFQMSVRAEDPFGNLAAPAFPRNFDLYIDGVFERRVTLAEEVTQIDGLVLENAGVHLIELGPAAGGIRTASNPILAMEREAPQVEWVSLREPVTPPHGVRSLALARREAAGRFSHFLPTSEPAPGWLNLGRGLEVQETRANVLAGGSRFRIKGPGQEIEMLLAENPTDLRGLPTNAPMLVEIAAGRSLYEWQGVAAANYGYAPAFAASVHSHAYSGLDWRTATAVVRQSKETLMSALARGSAYVTYGERILLLASLDAEATPAGMQLAAEMVAETGITQVELYKKGQLLQTFSFAEPEEEWLELHFFSASRPLGEVQSLPRNARQWLGFLSAEEGVLALARTQPNVSLSADRQRIDFLLRSHGRATGFRFRLRPVYDDSALTLALAAGVEDAAWLPSERLPAETLGEKMQLPLAELQQGALVQLLGSEGYQDRVELKVARPASSNYAALTYVDAQPTEAGDYYFFRVQTSGGGMAWSSPLYVPAAP